MTAIETPRTPWFLQGNPAPVSEDFTAFDLDVEGALPPGFNGL